MASGQLEATAMSSFLPRPAFNTDPTAKSVKVPVNWFPSTGIPDNNVYVYDVIIGDGTAKRGLMQKLWNSKGVQEALGKSHSFIYDGNKLAWSLEDIGEIRQKIDLDKEEGRVAKPRKDGKDNAHSVKVKRVGQVNMASLTAYLAKKTDFSSDTLQCITVLDHLVRETPSQRFITFKNKYYDRNTARKPLGQGIEAIAGIYQSIRPVQGSKLAVNVDTANTAFWIEQNLLVTAVQVCNVNNPKDIAAGWKIKQSKVVEGMSMLKRVRFFIKHRGKDYESKTHTVQEWGRNAKEHTMDVPDDAGNVVKMSVFDYFRKKYNITLQHWELPLIATRSPGVLFPMELCYISEGQRYPYKLSDTQIREMLAFASVPPAVRKQKIMAGLQLMNWGGDPVLKRYGVSIGNSMITTDAKLLTPPKVEFGGKATLVPQNGRWDLRGKKFYQTNRVPLERWGVLVCGTEKFNPLATVRKFIETFVRIYKSHGGVFGKNEYPVIEYAGQNTNVPELLRNLGMKVKNERGGLPQMVMFIVNQKSAEPYNGIKLLCDTQFGVPSQGVLWKHVAQAKDQYCSNVAMKFNAKLGGITSRLVSNHALTIKDATIVIGADVSHGAPGRVAKPSMAAMTASIDAEALSFTAMCNTNGYRVEIISRDNIRKLFMPLLRNWKSRNGVPPSTIMYFRDGISEGQYSHVLKQEIKDMKDEIAAQLPASYRPKFVVTICSKRHHTRFFPEASGVKDPKNGNPLPGLLVEKDVTHPTDNDFYLVSHPSPLGTARPAHYAVLLDEAKIPTNRFHRIVNDYCSAYMRATCSVSLFPAVYYAHLASKRALVHIPQTDASQSGTPTDTAVAPSIRELKPELLQSMWFI